MGSDEEQAACLALAVRGALAFGVAACGEDEESSGSGQAASSGDGGDVRARSRSTARPPWRPFAEAAAELFNEENPDVKITVGTSGTGGGFEKFCAGETDISDASRPIKDDEEVPVCEKNGVKYDGGRRSPTTASPSRRTRTWRSTA